MGYKKLKIIHIHCYAYFLHQPQQKLAINKFFIGTLVLFSENLCDGKAVYNEALQNMYRRTHGFRLVKTYF